jgi:hypothetical protein
LKGLREKREKANWAIRLEVAVYEEGVENLQLVSKEQDELQEREQILKDQKIQKVEQEFRLVTA